MELNIFYHREYINFDVITTLSQHLGDRLGKVYLFHYSPSVPQFKPLATMMSKSNSNTTTLHFQVQTLSPAILDFLCLDMPKLVSLGLVYEKLGAAGSDGGGSDSDPVSILLNAHRFQVFPTVGNCLTASHVQ
ncbi:hypothetical protein PC9H_002606 [Pleurotus ostreatus]|uniref:Uncharacterized protein n=1 Tax=Pleurotus ostreatus TaxID=5322 RepID=A0A8H6ZJT5_PLEOS|nr:uncharacterized protein PC9H_002606 [Pleurotus ostreatus]KAF7416341.1 hypothetical protein PC9H_002606 [Pleurotus ostreatus]KAJ8689230.1 hypothetical protein PTI98_013273 [Pleurotus ostreatus]